MNVFFVELIAFIVLVCISAFFSSAETAFLSIGPVKVRSLIESNVRGGKRLKKLLSQPRRLITGILIGNNIANVGASALSTMIITEYLSQISLNVSSVSEVAIVTGITTFVLLTFSEITPKSLAVKDPVSLALFMSPFIYIWLLILAPVINIFLGIAFLTSRLFRVNLQEVERLITESDLKTVIKMSSEEGVLEKEEEKMITGIFNFSDKVVREIMTSRMDVVCLEASNSVQDAIHLIQEKGHSRIPVFEDNIDNVVGIAYAKDLFQIPDTSIPIKKYLREPRFIPETNSIESLLQQMKVSKFHLAIVVDEYGGFSGIVTFEDIIEEIVGEVHDEYDTEERQFLYLSEGIYCIDARMNIADLKENIGVEFPEDEDYDTIGGFIISYLGRLPKQGESFNYSGIVITVKELYKRRLLKVVIDFSKEKSTLSDLEVGDLKESSTVNEKFLGVE